MNQIIVYHSQSDANSDWYWNQIFWPWVYNHWFACFVAGFVIGFTIMLIRRIVRK